MELLEGLYGVFVETFRLHRRPGFGMWLLQRTNVLRRDSRHYCCFHKAIRRCYCSAHVTYNQLTLPPIHYVSISWVDYA